MRRLFPRLLPHVMKLRIYTYKVTFEEIPHWYWGVHKEKKYDDGYLGSPVTHKWMWQFYTPKIQILEVFPFSNEGWAEACSIEKRLITPDLNNPLCLNERCGSIASLETLRKAAKVGGDKITKEGKGIHGRSREQMSRDGSKGKKSPGGLKAKEKGVGIFGLSVEEKSEVGRAAAKTTNSQIWESTVDGFRSTASAVAKHNRARGWDPQSRVRVY